MYTRHFSIAEFASKDGRATGKRMSPGIMEKLQTMRIMWGKPVKITSGIRSPEHNRAVGGSVNSRHLSGLAVDIGIGHLSPADRYEIISLAFRLRFDGIGISKDFIHLDTGRSSKALWFY